MNLKHRTRSWSLSSTPPALPSSLHQPSDSFPLPEQGGGRPNSQRITTPSISPKRLKYTFGTSSTNSNLTQEQQEQQEQRSCVEAFLQCLYRVVFHHVVYLDEDWRAARGLDPCTHMWNFYISVFLLFITVCGITLGGLALVGQYDCLRFDELYSQQECTVNGAVIVQYSLEGYVNTHWIPLRVSMLNPETGENISNVTGVAGGWIVIDRFPMPPVNGLITLVPENELIFTNNVAVSVEKANEFRSSLMHRQFPCLVPKPIGKIVENKDRISLDVFGMYPYSWAIDDLLQTMQYRNETCSSTLFSSSSSFINEDVGSVIEWNDGSQSDIIGAHHSNAGETFASKGRIIFVNATLDNDVKMVVGGFWLFFTSAVICVSVWPLVCACGRLHGWCWTKMYGYKTTGYLEDVINPLDRNSKSNGNGNDNDNDNDNDKRDVRSESQRYRDVSVYNTIDHHHKKKRKTGTQVAVGNVPLGGLREVEEDRSSHAASLSSSRLAEDMMTIGIGVGVVMASCPTMKSLNR